MKTELSAKYELLFAQSSLYTDTLVQTLRDIVQTLEKQGRQNEFTKRIDHG